MSQPTMPGGPAGPGPQPQTGLPGGAPPPPPLPPQFKFMAPQGTPIGCILLAFLIGLTVAGYVSEYDVDLRGTVGLVIACLYMGLLLKSALGRLGLRYVIDAGSVTVRRLLGRSVEVAWPDIVQVEASGSAVLYSEDDLVELPLPQGVVSFVENESAMLHSHFIQRYWIAAHNHDSRFVIPARALGGSTGPGTAGAVLWLMPLALLPMIWFDQAPTLSFALSLIGLAVVLTLLLSTRHRSGRRLVVDEKGLTVCRGDESTHYEPGAVFGLAINPDGPIVSTRRETYASVTAFLDTGPVTVRTTADVVDRLRQFLNARIRWTGVLDVRSDTARPPTQGGATDLRAIRQQVDEMNLAARVVCKLVVGLLVMLAGALVALQVSSDVVDPIGAILSVGLFLVPTLIPLLILARLRNQRRRIERLVDTLELQQMETRYEQPPT